MAKLLLVRDDVENDRADVLLREAAHLRSDLGVAADEVGTIRLKRQKRQKPVAVVMNLVVLPGIPQPSFPDRVGVLHRVFQQFALLGTVLKKQLRLTPGLVASLSCEDSEVYPGRIDS